jgi:hypothetical protein
MAILEAAANKSKEFIQRILNPEKYPRLDLGGGQYASHKMAWAEVEGKYTVFPTVQLDDGKLREFPWKKALKRAIESGNYINFDTPEMADWFSKRYKLAWGPSMERIEVASITTADRMAQVFTESGLTVIGIGNQIRDGLTNAFVAAFSAGHNFTSSLIQGMRSLAAQIAATIMQTIMLKTILSAFPGLGMFFPGVTGWAQGGVISGAYNGLLVGGSPGRDSIPIMATPGERVLSVQGNQNLEKLLAKLASGSGGNTVIFQIAGVDTETLRQNLRYGSLGRELARAGGF